MAAGTQARHDRAGRADQLRAARRPDRDRGAGSEVRKLLRPGPQCLLDTETGSTDRPRPHAPCSAPEGQLGERQAAAVRPRVDRPDRPVDEAQRRQGPGAQEARLATAYGAAPAQRLQPGVHRTVLPEGEQLRLGGLGAAVRPRKALQGRPVGGGHLARRPGHRLRGTGPQACRARERSGCGQPRAVPVAGRELPAAPQHLHGRPEAACRAGTRPDHRSPRRGRERGDRGRDPRPADGGRVGEPGSLQP